jgi:hypothetical protein
MSTKPATRGVEFTSDIRLRRMALLGEVIAWMWTRENGNIDEQEDADIHLDSTLRDLGLLDTNDAIDDVLYDSDEAVILFESGKRLTVGFSGQHFYTSGTCGI